MVAVDGSALAEVAGADELEAHSAQVVAADEVEAALLDLADEEEEEETPGVGFPKELLELRPTTIQDLDTYRLGDHMM